MSFALDDLERRAPRVVCLPDVFIDHFVELPAFEASVASLRAVHERGGGNWTGVRQRLAPGGNAANTARAMARLGVETHLIARTDAPGRALLEQTLGREGVRLERVRSDGRASTTTALEFGPERRNVMLSDSGGLADFGPEDLNAGDRALLAAADAVVVANWAQAARHGTALLEAVLRDARRGRALTYVDLADPTARAADLPDLVRRVLSTDLLDVLGLNENEARQLGGVPDAFGSAAALAGQVRATVDLHAPAFAATWGPGGHARVSAFAARPRRTTGAGDVWNAGNLVGHLLQMPPPSRLELAHAAATLYVEDADGRPPDRAALAAFLESRPTR